jgi:hypothetical protein
MGSPKKAPSPIPNPNIGGGVENVHFLLGTRVTRENVRVLLGKYPFPTVTGSVYLGETSAALKTIVGKHATLEETYLKKLRVSKAYLTFIERIALCIR